MKAAQTATDTRAPTLHQLSPWNSPGVTGPGPGGRLPSLQLWWLEHCLMAPGTHCSWLCGSTIRQQSYSLPLPLLLLYLLYLGASAHCLLSALLQASSSSPASPPWNALLRLTFKLSKRDGLTGSDSYWHPLGVVSSAAGWSLAGCSWVCCPLLLHGSRVKQPAFPKRSSTRALGPKEK